MAAIADTVLNLVSSISSLASRSQTYKTACSYLSLQCNEVHQRLENGELGPKDDPKLTELVDTLGRCRTLLVKITSYGCLLRLIRNEDIHVVIDEHRKALEKWTIKVPQVVPPATLVQEDLKVVGFEEWVSRRQKKPQNIAVLSPDQLEIGSEVGRFSFGTIHEGVYKGEPVLIRKVNETTKGASLNLIWSSIHQSRRVADCPNVLHVLGICQGRMIVTKTTSYGPLNDVPITNTLQKVEIARKVADTIMALHDINVGRGKKNSGVIVKDIRAANVLIDDGEEGEDEYEPRLTGFEMCNGNTDEKGNHPALDEYYRRWWAPETALGRIYSQSDVYAFGVLMYEISTGKEPKSKDEDLVEMENMRICAEYTNLMERCLNGRHHNARPMMEDITQELLAIELKLMGA